MPGFDTHGGSEIAEFGQAASGAREFGKVSFGSEAALFHNAAIPTVICGPGHIAQAHQPNEWIALEQLELCGHSCAGLPIRSAAHDTAVPRPRAHG